MQQLTRPGVEGTFECPDIVAPYWLANGWIPVAATGRRRRRRPASPPENPTPAGRRYIPATPTEEQP